MSLSLVTPPVLEPVTLDQQKLHSRISTDADDSLIEGLIKAARQYVETAQRRQIITATWRLSLDQFPCWDLYLPVPRLQSVVSITYVDTNGNEQTLDPSQYVTDTFREPGRLTPIFGLIWPPARWQANSVNVTFKSGYGDLPSNVPESTRQAIKLLAGHWYENREAVAAGTLTSVPLAVDSLLSVGKYGSYV